MRNISASLITAVFVAGVAAQGLEGATCGGFAALRCAEGLKCEDSGDDRCDPMNGGADCAGICKKDDSGNDNGGGTGTGGQSCGGIAGQTCPDGYECVDDPDDSCNTLNGGADCPGICKQSSGGSGSTTTTSTTSGTSTTSASDSTTSTTGTTSTSGTSSTSTSGASTSTTSGSGPLTSTSIVIETPSSSAAASTSAAASPGAAPGLLVDSLAWAAVGLGMVVGL